MSQLLAGLEECECGVVCLTEESLDSSYLLFEAGALARMKEARLYTVLIDDVITGTKFSKSPLSHFQAT